MGLIRLFQVALRHLRPAAAHQGDFRNRCRYRGYPEDPGYETGLSDLPEDQVESLLIRNGRFRIGGPKRPDEVLPVFRREQVRE